MRSPVRSVTYRKHTCVRIPLRLKKRWTFKPCHQLEICKQLNERNPPQLPTHPQKLLSRTLPPLMDLLHNPVPMLGHHLLRKDILFRLWNALRGWFHMLNHFLHTCGFTIPICTPSNLHMNVSNYTAEKLHIMPVLLCFQKPVEPRREN